MKTGSRIRNGFLLLFILINLSLHAQEPKPCGGYKINASALNEALKFEKEKRFAPAIGENILIRVYFHIFTYNDGSHRAATLKQIDSEFDTLAAAYANDNICFLYAGLDYIRSSFLDTGFNADENSSSAFDPYRVPNCINIFYSIKINGSNSACDGTCGYGGYAFEIPGTFCLIAQGNIGAPQTIAHEVGHCFGLYHTFETANGYEDIDGSNSTSAADKIADTPADPYAYNNKSCYSESTSGCTYNGTCKDPKGESNFSPPYTNLMAYWWPGSCYSPLAATSGQFTRANSFLSTYNDLQNCASPSTLSISNVSISSGYYMKSAVNTVTSGSNVNISGTAVATLGGGDILIKPGFHAVPSTSGLTLIRTDLCGTVELLAASEENAGMTKPDKQNVPKKQSMTDKTALTVYPNPTSSLVSLDFTTIKNERKVAILVYNIGMKQVKQIHLGQIQAGKQNIPVDFSGLASGTYFIIVQLQSGQLKAKVAVIR
jgi:hypothetical protein